MGIPVYNGPFGREQAERLLWRAGFGPKPGQSEALAQKGLNGAVSSLVNPPRAALSGPTPRADGQALSPTTRPGHDHLWWLDRMVRTNQPLVERMTLNWHDWFATRGLGRYRLVFTHRQNQKLRRYALTSFSTLLTEITRDPAMLLFLQNVDNHRGKPNENYARELMELFTLGVDRGYNQRDVKEQARALTGFTFKYSKAAGPSNFHFTRRYHDTGVKRIFGKRGRFDWRDSVTLSLRNPRHPSFFVDKLWSYFVPTPPDPGTASGLAALYRSRRFAIRPVVQAILKHPALYEGPRMVKPPTVWTAGLIRAVGTGVTQNGWGTTGYGGDAGQRLFFPPNVSGWDESSWLDTATFLGRWQTVRVILDKLTLDHRGEPSPTPTGGLPNLPLDPRAIPDLLESSQTAVDRALAFWGNPPITDATRRQLVRFADLAIGDADGDFEAKTYRVARQNGLRMLIATSPDLNTC